MELKEGFNRTDYGDIPNDWEKRNLGDLGVFKKGKGIKKDQVLGDGIPCVRYGELYTHHNTVVRKINSYISEQVASQSQRLTKGDLLFAGSGETAEEIGKCVAFLDDFEAYAGGDVIILTPYDLDSTFFAYLINFGVVALQKSKMGQGDAVVHIYPKNLAEICVPFPPLQEQSAIATALSDVDELLAELDALISKKRLIKEGAMQELLTGKKRITGFMADWEMTSLGRLGSTYGGLTGKAKSDFGSGSARYISFLNILNNVVIDTSILQSVHIGAAEKQNEVLKGDLFFNGSSETPEDVGMCAVLLRSVSGVYLNSFCFGFRLSDETVANGLYLAYFFRSGEGRKLLYSLAQGSTRHNLSKTALMSIEFRIPVTAEQVAIAEVLSDMDAEIVALQQRLEKVRSLKQGMMQELLTGRRRLT